ncbi:protein kinase domain-containing protein [Planctomicrobium sp. SH664]|uniref:serine/threonine protein kinase n=1 Tax=Planctomicrobium sp. SH664 TaxID=3448125 RepID=UPI003F5C8AA6
MAEADTIDGWDLVNCVATGSVTQIWEVAQGGQSMAMKLLLPEAYKLSEHRGALKHEYKVAKGLQHPNIIRVEGLKMSRKHGYFLMEYFRGGNVKGLIRSERAATQGKAKKLMECLSQALGHLHEKGWVHKDVKPDNVLLTKAGDVRLIDFSLASGQGNPVIHAVSKKSSIAIQGTRTYLAPELIRRERLTFSADMYSLGVLLFEVLTGHPPFRTANPNDLLMMHVRDKPAAPSDIDKNITPEVDQLVLRMLAKYPKERPANMQEVFSAVRSLKFFKEDPVELARSRAEEFAKSDAQAQNDRLNSRLDALRTESGEARPAPKPKPKPVVTLKEEKGAKKPAAPAAAPVAAAAAPPPMYPPQPFPGYPGMPYPGAPMMPGMPMGGFPMQPGMPMPGYPGMPPQGMPMPMPGGFPGMPGQMMPGHLTPGQGMPGQGMPMPPGPFPPMPGMPPGMGLPPQPGMPMPATPQPPRPVPAGPAPANVPNRPVPAAAPPEDIPLASIDDLQIE